MWIVANLLGHFPALLLFALLASLALSCLAQRSPFGRIRYLAWAFILFVLIAVGFAWAMYPLSR